MNNTFYILRHAETEIEADRPVSEWNLSTAGRLQSEQLCNDRELRKVQIIICSAEDKAYQTALPLARMLGKKIDKYRAFDELNRDRTGLMPREKWNFAVKYAMKNPDKSKLDWEKASRALERFSRKIGELDHAYNKRRILVVTHGIVMNLYFAQLQGKLQFAFERMLKTNFCSYAIVKNNSVLRDITQ